MSNKQISSGKFTVLLGIPNGFPLTKLTAAKRASTQRSLANGHDEEIASITDFSDDDEKEMYVISL